MTTAFKADYSGVEPKEGGGSFTLVARGKYLAKVKKAEPGKSAAGNPKVTVEYVIIGGTYDGVELRYHTVTFLPKSHQYAGISLGVLKHLRQPYKGKFSITPDNWLDKHVYINVDVEPFYSEKFKKELDRNKVTGVTSPSAKELIELGEDKDAFPEWLTAQASEKGADSKPAEDLEEVPF